MHKSKYTNWNGKQSKLFNEVSAFFDLLLCTFFSARVVYSIFNLAIVSRKSPIIKPQILATTVCIVCSYVKISRNHKIFSVLVRLQKKMAFVSNMLLERAHIYEFIVSRLWVFRPHSMCNAAPNVLCCFSNTDANRIAKQSFLTFAKVSNSKTR